MHGLSERHNATLVRPTIVGPDYDPAAVRAAAGHPTSDLAAVSKADLLQVAGLALLTEDLADDEKEVVARITAAAQ